MRASQLDPIRQPGRPLFGWMKVVVTGAGGAGKARRLVDVRPEGRADRGLFPFAAIFASHGSQE
jgi:hypothetical protein